MANVLLIHRDGTVSGPFPRSMFKGHHAETNSDDFRLVLAPTLKRSDIWETVPIKKDDGSIDLTKPGIPRQKFIADIDLLFNAKKFEDNIVPMSALKAKAGG